MKCTKVRYASADQRQRGRSTAAPMTHVGCTPISALPAGIPMASARGTGRTHGHTADVRHGDAMSAVVSTALLILFLAGNAGLLTYRLWRLAYRSKGLELGYDALVTITGVYLIANIVDMTVSGEIGRWGFIDYVLVGLVGINVVLPVTRAVLVGRKDV